MWRHLCFGRNQDAGDCCFQGKDLGAIATRCQHRKGAHSADSWGVWHRKVPDGLQTNWRNQRYVVSSLWTDTSHLLSDLTNNILCSSCLFYLHFDIYTYWHTSVCRLHCCWKWQWSHRHPGIPSIQKHVWEDPPGNVWEEWLQAHCPWAIPGCRPKRQSCYDR